jgi:uroporphyrinogen decarboxylase
MTGRERFLAALAGERLERPPVWLMRQAGRYLPGYREVRAHHGFWDVCHSPELSTHVALEPLKEFRLDAAIVFSDILVVPQALGLGVSFGKGEGPQVAHPLRSEADLEKWNTAGLIERLQFLPRAVSHLRDALQGSHGMLGFAGAPWTLFCYSAEGSSDDEFQTARVLLHTQPQLAKKALFLLADAAAELLEAQCEAGCDAVQLFDTWGGLLPADTYAELIAPSVRRITERLHAKGRKVLIYLRGGQHLVPVIRTLGVDGLSLDWRTPFSEARAALPDGILQGNLDPVLLFTTPDVVRARTQAMLASMGDGRRCIANLGHGILPGTPVESVRAMVDAVVEHRQ